MIKHPEMERAREITKEMVYPTPPVTSDSISSTAGLKVYFPLDDQHVYG